MTLIGCGPEVTALEFAELCGVTGPVRVLELPADEQIRYQRPLRIGDRVLYVISKRAADDPDARFPAITGTTVWSTGPCGEAPVRLATGVRSIFTVPAWPEVVLGCEEGTGNIVSLDPTGKLEPHVVFADVPHGSGCGLRWTEYGLLSVEPHDEELGALMLHPYPADPRVETAAPIVLLDPIRITESNVSGTSLIGDVLRTFDEFVLAVTPEDTLVQVDLADGAVTALEPQVSAFAASFDGRHVLWQDTAVTQPDPDYPGGKIFLRDQTTGTSAFLAETSLKFSIFPLHWAELDVVQLGLGYFNRDPKRIYFLPELDHVEVPGDLMLNGKLEDGRWLTSTLLGSTYDLVDLRGGGEVTRLFPRKADITHIDGEAAELIEVPGCCIDGDYLDEGPMWRVPLASLVPEPMARRATRLMRRAADGRIITPVSLDAQWLGPLILVDPTTQAEWHLDDRVFAFSLDPAWTDEEDVISYSVSDGERSGVYLARLPPRERTGPVTAPRRIEARVFDLVPGPDGRPTPRPRAITDLPYFPGDSK